MKYNKVIKLYILVRDKNQPVTVVEEIQCGYWLFAFI